MPIQYADKRPVLSSDTFGDRIPEKSTVNNSMKNLKSSRFRSLISNFITNLAKCLISNLIKCITPSQIRHLARYGGYLPLLNRIWGLVVGD